MQSENPGPKTDDGISDVLKTTHSVKLLLAIFLIVLAVTCWQFSGPKDALASAGWSNNWEAAIAQSRTSGKPALVLFTADWCPACKQFESEALTQNDVKKYLRENYTLITVDLSDRNGPNNSRARDYGVRIIPTLILYDKSSNEVARGFDMPADALLLWLRTGGAGVRFSAPE